MPVLPDSLPLERRLDPRAGQRDANCLEIGLVNNMPGKAFEATERQFRSLLAEAAEGIVVHLSQFALPGVPRSDQGRCRISGSYSSLSDLWDNHLDGIIVTGTEPQASDLRDEPYWESLTRLLEWADHNTASVVCSCLAAHAGVLHLDGIVRRPLRDKLSGVFESARVSEHLLTAGLPARFWTPHSRWNDIPEQALAAGGYQILTRSREAGVDAFVKQRKSLFVFFQGHPEYETDSLWLEYRRDIRRFLNEERVSYPSMPHGCFDEVDAAALTAFRERALLDCKEESLEQFPVARLAANAKNAWRPAAVSLYRNWLLYLCAQKDQRLKHRRGQAQYQPAGAATLRPLLETDSRAREQTGDQLR